MRMHNPPHPGLALREFLGDLTVTEAASRLRITRTALSRILNGSAGISADMALRLRDALGTSAEMWINMKAQYELRQDEKKTSTAQGEIKGTRTGRTWGWEKGRE